MVEQQAPVREAVPARPGSDVFISYSRHDRQIVERLASALEARGRSTWVDWADIPPTAEWMSEITVAIDASDTVVVVLSPDSVASTVCGEELDAAVAANKRIVPVVVREVEPAEVSPELAKRNWLFLRPTDAFEAGVDTLVATLDTDLEATRFHTGLLVKAREWEQAGAPRSRLLRGSDLSQAETYVAAPGKGPAPTQEQTSFVLASRRAATRRQRSAIAIATVVAVVAATLGVFAWTQRSTAVEQRDRAEHAVLVANSRALASRALLKMSTNTDLGDLLAVEAYEIAPTREALEAVHIAAQRAAWVDRTVWQMGGGSTEVAYDPNGRFVASAGGDGKLSTWDPSNGVLLASASVDDAGVSDVAVSPAGDAVATASHAGIDLWDPNTGGHLLGPFSLPHNSARCVTVSPKGDLLAGGFVGRVAIWNARTGNPIGEPLQVGETSSGVASVASVAFSSSGRLFAAATSQGDISVWDSSTLHVVDSVDTNAARLSSIAFSPNGKLLAVGSLDRSSAAGGDILMRDVMRHRWSGRLEGHTDTILDVAFAPDGATLVSTSVDRTIRVWNVRTHDEVGSPIQGPSGAMRSIAFSPDGRTLIAGGSNGDTRFFDIGQLSPSEAGRAVNAVALDPRGQRLATAEPYGFSSFLQVTGSGAAVLRDAETTRKVLRLPFGVVHPYGAAFSPDGSWLAISDLYRGIFRWSLDEDRPLSPLSAEMAPNSWLDPLALSPSGSMIAASDPRDRRIFVWDVASGELATDPLQAEKGVYPVAFSPDETELAAGGWYGRIQFWDTRTWAREALIDIGQREIMSLAYSPDGSVLAAGGFDHLVSVWDPGTRGRVAALDLGEGIISLAFSPDGAVLAAGTESGAIVLIDAHTWTTIGEPLDLQRDWVNSVTFDPHGTFLVAGSEDGSIVRLDRSTWTDDWASLRARLCDAAGRNLTKSEWSNLIPSEPYRDLCES